MGEDNEVLFFLFESIVVFFLVMFDDNDVGLFEVCSICVMFSLDDFWDKEFFFLDLCFNFVMFIVFFVEIWGDCMMFFLEVFGDIMVFFLDLFGDFMIFFLEFWGYIDVFFVEEFGGWVVFVFDEFGDDVVF